LPFPIRFVAGALALTLLSPAPALAADTDLDALELKSAPEEAAATALPSSRLFVEGAIGRLGQRYGLGTETTRRGSLDVLQTFRLSPEWRAVLSDRLDHIRPAEPNSDRTLNSLREAYVSWAAENGETIVELGRINLRYGPAYGYNPTDFFRDGALRAVTTANPFALRENRLGTVVLRGQQLWPTGSVSLALSPKLQDEPSGEAFNLDLGRTNHVDRGLLVVSQQFSERVSAQALLYKEDGQTAQPGASVTALLSDSTVAHAEWSFAREPPLLQRALGDRGSPKRSHRFAVGLTYTTPTKLSLTAEFEGNGLALGRADVERLAATNPAALGAYLAEAAFRNDLASRRAVLLYATQRDLGAKNLDLTAFVRVNSEDRSRLTWVELRYHWTRVDLALQVQNHSGKAASEFGFNPFRTWTQLLVAYHFR
jgi:hypothetical protein